jgi:hypothetical protein
VTPRRRTPDIEAVLAEVANTADTLVEQSKKMALDHASIEQTNARLQKLVVLLKEKRDV